MKDYKQHIVNILRKRGYLWSYNSSAIINDETIIEKSLTHLEFEEIPKLIDYYGYRKVKQIWKQKMLPQGKYLETLNWLLAVLFFKENNPDKLIKKYELA